MNLMRHFVTYVLHICVLIQIHGIVLKIVLVVIIYNQSAPPRMIPSNLYKNLF